MNGNGIPQTIKNPLDDSEMHLTWNDEFDGDKINGKTWQLYDRMWAKNRVIATTDPRNFALENGEAVMRTYREDGHYTSHKTLTTFDRMSFRYGYLEIRAMVPFSRGAFPAFWLQSAWQHRSVDYMTEVDVFEVYKAGYVEATLHKWYLKDPVKGPHFRHDWNTPLAYTFPEDHWETLSREYHRWGFLWDPESIRLTVDGKVFATYDITDAGDFQEGLGNGDDLTGMGGFQDPMTIVCRDSGPVHRHQRPNGCEGCSFLDSSLSPFRIAGRTIERNRLHLTAFCGIMETGKKSDGLKATAFGTGFRLQSPHGRMRSMQG